MKRINICSGTILFCFFGAASLFNLNNNTLLILLLLLMNYVYHKHICDIQDIIKNNADLLCNKKGDKK